MGIFAIGKTCYDFVYSIEDIELICYYVPSIEELYLNTYKYNYCEEFNDVKMIDFRYVYNLLLEQDRITMEAAFTNYKIINKLYKQSFEKYVLMNKEALFHYDSEKKIYNSTQRALQLLNSNMSKEDLFEVCRIRIACELLLSGNPIKNCINIKKDYHINYLTDILNNRITPNLKDLKNDLLELQKKSENYNSIENTKKLFKELLLNMYTI